MFKLWKNGLRDSFWVDMVESIRYNPLTNRNWTDMEVIYALERIMVYYNGEPMLQEMTFVLRRGVDPVFPDFRTWNDIGPIYVYAYDELGDHSEWLKADAEFHFYWHGVYRKVLPHPNETAPQPHNSWDNGGQAESENEEMEEAAPGEEAMEIGNPEEDPEEDPDEDPEEDPEEEIEEDPNNGQPEPPADHLWNSEYEPSNFSMGRRSVSRTPSLVAMPQEPQGNVVLIDSDTESLSTRRSEGTSPQQETRLKNKKRMSVRRYLKEFMGKRYRGSSSRNGPSSPPCP